MTFDDGLREQYEFVAPILLKEGVSAVFFITTDFLDNRKLFYRMKISLLLNHLHQHPEESGRLEAYLEEQGIIQSAEDFIRQTGYPERRRLDAMAEALNLSFDDFLLQKKPFMTSVQIAELARNGFLIGTHGMDHAPFGDLDPADQIGQLSMSMAIIMANFQPKIRTFAFPFGEHNLRQDFFKIVAEKDLMDLSFGNDALIGNTIKNHFPRFFMDHPAISPEEAVRRLHIHQFRAMLQHRSLPK